MEREELTVDKMITWLEQAVVTEPLYSKALNFAKRAKDTPQPGVAAWLLENACCSIGNVQRGVEIL